LATSASSDIPLNPLQTPGGIETSE
jgi:hypothetical protein